MLRTFTLVKIQRLRPGLNPRTREPEVSTLTTRPLKPLQGGKEVKGRRARRGRKLLDDLKERRGYFHLKEEALDRTMWTARFGRGFGPVVRQTAKCKWTAHVLNYCQCVFELCLLVLAPKNVDCP
jgi:hypothetical protein